MAPSDGPWAAANAERDAHIALRAVLYVLKHDEAEVGANAQSFAVVIASCVGTGDEKALLTSLSALTYFLTTVHMGRNPFDDSQYVAYSKLLATHFMNAAESCMPGRRALPENVWKANAARKAANVSTTSMAWVEALEIVGSSMAAAANAERRDPGPVETPSDPRELIVSADGAGAFTTIGAAQAAATQNDEIVVRPGDYVESLVIGTSVTIRGDGPREEIINVGIEEEIHV